MEISDDAIAVISEQALDGARVIDAMGLTVSPDFIDNYDHPGMCHTGGADVARTWFL